MRKVNFCIKPDSYGLMLAPFSPSPSQANTRRFPLPQAEKKGMAVDLWLMKIIDLWGSPTERIIRC